MSKNTYSNNTLGDRLKRSRHKLNLTQTDVARRSGVSQQLIQQLESGLVIGTKHIFSLAVALECDARWLRFGDINPDDAMPSPGKIHLAPPDPIGFYAETFKASNPLEDRIKDLEKQLATYKKANDALLDLVQHLRGEK